VSLGESTINSGPSPGSGNGKTKPTIAFILDSSSSMKDSDPQDIRKSAVEQIIDLLNGDENIFLVDFDHRGTWLNQDHWNKWGKAQLKSDVQRIDSYGNTNVGLGISTLSQAMEPNMTDFSRTAVVLLTDGLGGYNNEADWFAKRGIKIYTVSYKNKADASLLSSIAGGTGGIYLQANNENETVAAFMQFFYDLRGNSKFISNSGFFQGQKLIQLPQFYIDNNTSYLTVNVNWSGSTKVVTLISPSGKQYTSSQAQPQAGLYPNFLNNDGFSGNVVSKGGPNVSWCTNMLSGITENAKWTVSNNYLVVKIDNPESGKWSATLETADGKTSTDSYLFEAGGSTPTLINLNQKPGGLGYAFQLDFGKQLVDLANSTAAVLMVTPDNKEIDISKNFRNGAISFYPSNGKGNYTLRVSLQLKDRSGSLIQRQFTRSVLVGDILPGYMAPVRKILGNYLETEQGLQTGNRAGIKCYIYSPGGSKNSPKAIGYVQNVADNKCTIKVTQILSSDKIMVDDIIELDLLQWSNDKI
jgi:hypothetical protein